MSTFAYDLFSNFNERWKEVYLLLDMITDAKNQAEVDALCRANTVLIIANFEGFLSETIKMIISDVNRFGSYKNTPYKMKSVLCSQYIDINDKGQKKRLDKLIGAFSDLETKYTIEPFLFESNKNPKPTALEEYFEKLGGKNFFSYLTDCRLETVFENNKDLTHNLIHELYGNLMRGVEKYPYLVDLTSLDFNLENRKINDCLWMTFLNQTLKKRHSVAHGMTLDNVATHLELHDVVDKIKVLELCFATLCCYSIME